jgi:hypothetical protein
MTTPDEIREDLTTQIDGWLARRNEIQEMFVDQMDDPRVDAALGLSLIGAGVGTVVANIIRGKRSAWAYLIPAVLILGGLAVMSGGAVSRRSERILVAEQGVREQLADLDPIARAQVLRSAASETLAPFIHRSPN